MDSQDKTRFEIHGKSSVKYHLKANHVVEAKRWFWSLNNAIQWAKDEAKEEERQRNQNAEVLRQAKMDQSEGRSVGTPSESGLSHRPSTKSLAPPSTLGVPGNSITRLNTHASRTTLETTPEDEASSAYGSLDQSTNEVNRVASRATTMPDGDGNDDDEEFYDYASSHDAPTEDKDALNITAQSAKLQLDLLANVTASLQAERTKNPSTAIGDPSFEQALGAYEGAVSSLKGLVQSLLKISRDRDSYWQYRLNREEHLRQMWEESMARVAQEHEELQSKMGESEEKRKRTKRALKEALENANDPPSRAIAKDQDLEESQEDFRAATEAPEEDREASAQLGARPTLNRKHSTLSKISSLYDSESDGDEFFDAIDAGDIEVEDMTQGESQETKEPEDESSQARNDKVAVISPSFKGYEEPVRQRLKMDNDNRPKIGLWVSKYSIIHRIWHFANAIMQTTNQPFRAS